EEVRREAPEIWGRRVAAGGRWKGAAEYWGRRGRGGGLLDEEGRGGVEEPRRWAELRHGHRGQGEAGAEAVRLSHPEGGAGVEPERWQTALGLPTGRPGERVLDNARGGWRPAGRGVDLLWDGGAEVGGQGAEAGVEEQGPDVLLLDADAGGEVSVRGDGG